MRTHPPDPSHHEHTSAPRSSLFLIIAGIVAALLLVVFGSWAALGVLTGNTARHGFRGFNSHGDPTRYIKTDRVTIVCLDDETRPLAVALRDKLASNTMYDTVTIADDFLSGPATDLYITLAQTKTEFDRRSPMNWREEINIGISAGPTPVQPRTYGATNFHAVNRDSFIRGSFEYVNRGAGMPQMVTVDPDTFATEAARHINTNFGSSNWPDLPEAAFGKPAPPPEIPAIQSLAPQLLHNASGMMLHQSTSWLTHTSQDAVPFLDRIDADLLTDGWQINQRSSRYRVFQRDDAYLSVSHIDHTEHHKLSPYATHDPRNSFVIHYAKRFSQDEQAAAAEAIWNRLGDDPRRLIAFEAAMSDAQRKRLVAVLESAPQPTAQWHYDMATRHLRYHGDRDKAIASLQQSKELAIQNKDYRFLHDRIWRYAYNNKLAPLNEPLTADELIALGLIPIREGRNTATIKPTERVTFFAHSGEHIVLLTLHLTTRTLAHSSWSYSGSMSSSSSSTHRRNAIRDTDNVRNFGKLELECTPAGTTDWHIELTFTPSAP